MLRIPCPHCGLRDQDEFMAWGHARPDFPDLDAPLPDWVQQVYARPNPRGKTQEYFQHVLGCRRWLIVERDNVTHDVHSAKAAA